jgi:hypothetical protein
MWQKELDIHMRSISHLQLMIHSLIHPKKLAAFRILPIGKVIQYTFLLVAIMTAFSFGQFVQNGISSIQLYEEIQDYAEDLEWLIYFISVVLSFIMNTLLLYAKISAYAFVGLLVGKSMNRKLEYRHIWRTAAFAITWEVFLSILFTSISLNNIVSTIVVMFITIGIIIISLTKYPIIKGSVKQ